MRTREGSFRGGRSRLPLLLGAVALAPGAAGCMTAVAQAAYFRGQDPDVSPCGIVYLGTLMDFALAITGGVGPCSGDGVAEHALGIIDLPLSLAADTALLPLTIPETIELTLRRRRDDEREMEEIRRRKEGADAE